MSSEDEKGIEKWRKRINIATLGAVAVGFIFGLSGLVIGGAFHIATSETLGKGFTKWVEKRKGKQT